MRTFTWLRLERHTAPSTVLHWAPAPAAHLQRHQALARQLSLALHATATIPATPPEPKARRKASDPGSPAGQEDQAHMGAPTESPQAPPASANRAEQQQVPQQEDSRVHHEKHSRRSDAESRAEMHRCGPDDSGTPALQAADMDIVLDEVAQHREHSGELQRMAEPEPRRCDPATQEGGPTSAPEGERQGYCCANAGAQEDPRGVPGCDALTLRFTLSKRVGDRKRTIPALICGSSPGAQQRRCLANAGAAPGEAQAETDHLRRSELHPGLLRSCGDTSTPACRPYARF
mmetsp:Transcript_20547/g.43723  ORF Transcript_20547/g.43723 Transcript_20547/m.43723 type:complete len:289 (-) Transcript_20547:30-896(-)